MGNISGFIGGQIGGFREKFYPKKEPAIVESKYGGVPESIPKPEYTVVPQGFVKPTPYAPSYTPEESYIKQQPPVQPSPGFISGQTQKFLETFSERGRAQKEARESEIRYEELAVQISEQNTNLRKYEKLVDENDMFTGSDTEYAAYSRTFDKHKRDINEYNEIAVKINKKIEEEEEKRKAQFLGARGKAEGAYARGEKWLTTKVHKVLPAWDDRVVTQFYKPYEAWSPGEKEILEKYDPITQMLAKSPTYYKFRTGVSEHMFGFYKETRERPLRQMLTTSAFIALPPVLKGLSKVGKVSGLAPITVGGFLPKWTRHVPKAAAYGLGALYTGSIGYELYKTPVGLRGEQFGRITARDIAPMMVGTYIGLGLKIPRIPKIGKKRISLTEEILAKKGRAFTMKDILAQEIAAKKVVPTKVKPKEPTPIEPIKKWKDIEKPQWLAEEIKAAQKPLKPIEDYYFPEKYVPLTEVAPKPVRRKLRVIEKPKTIEELLIGTELKVKIAPKVKIKVKPKVKTMVSTLLQQQKWTRLYTIPITKLTTKPITETLTKTIVDIKVKPKKKIKRKIMVRTMLEVVALPKTMVETKVKVKPKVITKVKVGTALETMVKQLTKTKVIPIIPKKPKKKKKLTKAQLRKLRQTLVLNPIKTPLEVLQWRL